MFDISKTIVNLSQYKDNRNIKYLVQSKEIKPALW